MAWQSGAGGGGVGGMAAGEPNGVQAYTLQGGLLLSVSGSHTDRYNRCDAIPANRVA